MCAKIAHLSPKAQEIVLFLSANFLNKKAALPSFIVRGGYSRVAAKVKNLLPVQVVHEGFKIQLFDHISYSRGVVEFKFSEPIEQLLSERGKYLFCNFEKYCNLRKKYAKAMYLILCQYRGSGKIDQALHLLANRIGATAPSYRYLCRLRHLIEDALDQIASNDENEEDLCDMATVNFVPPKKDTGAQDDETKITTVAEMKKALEELIVWDTFWCAQTQEGEKQNLWEIWKRLHKNNNPSKWKPVALTFENETEIEEAIEAIKKIIAEGNFDPIVKNDEKFKEEFKKFRFLVYAQKASTTTNQAGNDQKENEQKDSPKPITSDEELKKAKDALSEAKIALKNKEGLPSTEEATRNME